MLLVLKLVLVPALIGAVTIAARRWGLRVGGLLTALPMVAGPTLCFYALEQGHQFAATAGRHALLGIAATGLFCLIYAHASRRGAWGLSLLAGLLTFSAGATIANALTEFGALGAFSVAVAVLLAAHAGMPRIGVLGVAPLPPQWDVPVRMITAAAVVVVLTALAEALGPRVSGVLSAFPVATSILAVFTHAQRGADAVAAFLRGLLRGLHGFAVFCLVFSISLAPAALGLPAAVTLGLVAQISVQGLILWRMSRRESAIPASTPTPRS